MFVQAEESKEFAQGGLGIGLTLVRQLVLMHDGTIQARSEGKGRGSEFDVMLPLVVDAAGRRRQASPTTMSMGRRSGESSSRTITRTPPQRWPYCSSVTGTRCARRLTASRR